MIPLLVTGLLGSLHCVGMCGGFALALGRPGRPAWSQIAVQALFLLGKASTYVLLGGLVGLAGAALVRAPGFAAAQTVLAIVAGILMVLFGLQILGVLKELPLGSLFGPESLYGRAIAAVMRARHPAAPFVFGILTGFLPCPLVYAFLAEALGTGSILGAMGVMGLLGLCTVPALALVALTGAVAAPHLRAWLIRVAGVVVIVLGVITFLRGAALDAVHLLH